jgi:hypothetical protein
MARGPSSYTTERTHDVRPNHHQSLKMWPKTVHWLWVADLQRMRWRERDPMQLAFLARASRVFFPSEPVIRFSEVMMVRQE